MSHQPGVVTERIDDVPLLIEIMHAKLGYDQALDALWARHGNWLGLSLGQVMVTWLAHILSQCRHTMQPVEAWANVRAQMLSRVWGQELRETDLGDDRLAEVLRVLSLDHVWHPLEQAVTQHAVRVYALPRQRVRLDATSVNVYGDGRGVSVLFRKGHSKDYRHDLAQFKVMLASLDPLGMPLAVDVVPGNQNDDGLYVPLLTRVRATLGVTGLLYLGDCKMGALATRAQIQQAGDFYLMPLALTGRLPEAMALWVQQALDGQVALTPIRAADGQTSLGAGYEVTRAQSTTLDGQEVAWTERVLIVHSQDYIQACYRKLEHALRRAETALQGLAQPPGHGRPAIESAAELLTRAQEIVARHTLPGLLTLSAVRHSRQHRVRGYAGRPARVEEQEYYTLQVQRDAAAIAAHQRTLGWRVYATNAPQADLPLEVAVLAYRDEWLIERDLARLKGRPLSLASTWLTREDHVIGLTRLLTLAARVLALVEYQVRQQLQAEAGTLTGLYAGQSTRSTDRPTTERLLEAFKEVNLTVIHLDSQVLYHVTPLSALQEAILRLLDCPRNLYGRLAPDSS